MRRAAQRVARARLHLFACLFALEASCITEQRYHVLDQRVQLTADAQPAYFVDEDEPVYRVDAPFTLRITPPDPAAEARLASAPAELRAPYPRLAWVALHDLELELDYALSNDADEPITALITINGINEFHFYAPGPEQLHQWERRVALGPRERITGSITELELDEVAIDLATVVNGPENSNLVVDRRSQSSLDPRVRPFIPKAVPGLVGLRAGLEAGRAQPLTLTLTIRVQDHDGRAAARGEPAWLLPEPQPFVPVVPVEE